MFALGCLLGVTLTVSIIMGVALKRHDNDKKSAPPAQCSVSGCNGKYVFNYDKEYLGKIIWKDVTRVLGVSEDQRAIVNLTFCHAAPEDGGGIESVKVEVEVK